MFFTEESYDADVSSTTGVTAQASETTSSLEVNAIQTDVPDVAQQQQQQQQMIEEQPQQVIEEQQQQVIGEQQEEITVKAEAMDNAGMNIDVQVPSEFSHPEQEVPVQQLSTQSINTQARAKSVREMLNRMLGRDKHADEIIEYEDMAIDEEPQNTGMAFPARKDPTMTFPVRPQPYFPPQRMVEKSEIRSFGPSQQAWNPNPYGYHPQPDYHGYGQGYFQTKQEPYAYGIGGVGKRQRKRKYNKPKKSQKVDPSLPHKKSKYKGVYWERRDQKWRARTYVHGKRYSGGSYVNERECALAVNRLCEVMGVPPLNPELEGLSLGDSTFQKKFEFKGRPYRPRSAGSIRVKQESQYFPTYSYGNPYGGFPQDELAF